MRNHDQPFQSFEREFLVVVQNRQLQFSRALPKALVPRPRGILDKVSDDREYPGQSFIGGVSCVEKQRGIDAAEDNARVDPQTREKGFDGGVHRPSAGSP